MAGVVGDDPPFHLPVFVLTHDPRPPLKLRGTAFALVTDGIDTALKQARAAAGDRDFAIGGGASWPGGLVRLREFLMKDAYSFHSSPEDLDALYSRMLQAYFRVYARAAVPVMSVASDTGLMGGDEAHEFMLITPGGEDMLVLCRSCGYAANREVADGLVPPGGS